MPLKKISFGQKEESQVVEKFKGVEDAPSILSLVDKEGIMVAALHFANGIGSFHCFDGVCCLKEGAPRTRYVIPVVNYRVKNINTCEINTDSCEIQYLLASTAIYEKLIKLDEISDISNMDILVTTESEDFQKYTMKPILDENTGLPRHATWREDEILRAKVLSYYNTFYAEKISMSLGKTINASEYARMKAESKNNQSNNNSGSRIPEPPEQKSQGNVPQPPPIEEEPEEETDEIPFDNIEDKDLDGLYSE